MKDRNSLSEDEFRKRVDGFSMKKDDKKTVENGYKIVDEPLYPTHSADYDKVKK